jgi:adenosine kinase
MDILLTGSVAYDYLMTFPGHFKDQILPERLGSISLSFLVDSMSKQRGGVAPNIAYTMALLGERPRVMATVGEDFEDYRAWLEAKGVDTSLMCVVPRQRITLRRRSPRSTRARWVSPPLNPSPS